MAAAPLIMGGASLVGGLLGGKGQKKAAKESQTLINNDNAANRTFLEGLYNRNYGLIYPTVQSGQVAGNAIMELLGYPQQQAQPSAFAGYNPSFGGNSPGSAFSIPRGGVSEAFPYGWEYGDGSGVGVFGGGPQPNGSISLTGDPGAVTTTAPSARSAFDTYRGSTGYDFRVNEGVRAVQSAFGRNLDSGAFKKAAVRYGQGIASDEFGRYIGYLTGQQQLGLSGASALAGVTQNFGNTVVAGNQGAATAAANARLYAGNANAQMWQNLGSSFGGVAGRYGGF